jgi:hypothetical protein
MEHNISGWNSQNVGMGPGWKAAAFTSPYQPECHPWCSSLCPWLLSSGDVGDGDGDGNVDDSQVMFV